MSSIVGQHPASQLLDALGPPDVKSLQFDQAAVFVGDHCDISHLLNILIVKEIQYNDKTRSQAIKKING
jgi:hypothetical protein